jgi:thiol-disulfide isomerase/thioredoxin
MPMRRIVVALLIALATQAGAEGPDALKIVKDASDYVKGLDAFGVAFKVSTHLEVEGQTRDITLDADVLLKGGQQSILKIKTDTDEAQVTCTGADLYLYLPKQNKFKKLEAPLDREDTLGMISGGAMRPSTIWLGQFVNGSLDLLQDATGAFVGEESGQQHVKLTYPNLSVDLWFSGSPALLQKMEMDVTNALGPPGQGPAKAVNTLTFSNWQTAPELTAQHFAWKAPEGATEESSDPNKALVGKAAPDFTLGMLAGGEMKLSSHKDKDVVILDFFATWCGPCRMSMPVVNDVANEYKSKGVAFYAVNCGEEAEKVKSYLAGQKLDLPVAMDATSKVQMTYGANSIPRMIVVGKDGTVQAVHAGFSPDLGRTLRQQIDTLLSGKSLVD